jgi:hypothetical protein
LEILNIENSVVLLKTFPKGISLTEILETKKFGTFKRTKMITELLQLLHEISGSYLFWATKQNFQENIIYSNEKEWIFINTCSLDYHGKGFDTNLKKFVDFIGPDFKNILKMKFWNCREDCSFSKRCKMLFDE